MTIEEYNKAGSIVRMIESCDAIMKQFDEHFNVSFEITALHNHEPIAIVSLTDSGAQMLYNAINYTKNTLKRELEDI